MSEATEKNELQDSIKISKNSKGYTWEIKRYYDFEKTEPKDVTKQLKDMDTMLKTTFGGV